MCPRDCRLANHAANLFFRECLPLGTLLCRIASGRAHTVWGRRAASWPVAASPSLASLRRHRPSTLLPRVSSVVDDSRIGRTRSTRPVNSSPAPAEVGSGLGKALAPSRSRTMRSTCRRVGPQRGHLVDERSRTPYRSSWRHQPSRLRFYCRPPASRHRDGAVRSAQAALHFDGEIHVARGFR